MARNAFLNQFGQSGRDNPTPLAGEMPSLGLPTNVPFVQAPNMVPSNIGDMAKFSKMNQLAAALGTPGFGSGKMQQSIMEALQKKKDMENNLLMHQGLVDATTRAGGTRDIYSDVTQRGIVPAHKNPYYVLGYQGQLSLELAAQYRKELAQARLENPAMDPQELQDQIKQKYTGLLPSLRPDIAAKFFIEPSSKADEEDFASYQKTQATRFEEELVRSSGETVNSALSSAILQYQSGNADASSVQDTVKRSMEGSLQLSYATGKDFNTQLEGMFSAVSYSAANLTNKDGSTASLKDKLMVLDALKGVNRPTGQPLLFDPKFQKKYGEAREQLIRDALEIDKTQEEARALERQRNTEELEMKMVRDASQNKLQNPQSYLSQITGPVKPSEVVSFHNSLNSQFSTPIEYDTSNDATDMMEDAHRLTPTEFHQKYRGVVKANPKLREVYTSGYNTAESEQKAKSLRESNIPVPTSAINSWLNTINVPIGMRSSAKRFTGYSQQTVQEGVNKDFKNKYGTLMQIEYLQWAKANPEAAKDKEMQVTKVQEIATKLDRQLRADYERFQKREGGQAGYLKLRGTGELPTSTATPPPKPPASKPAAVKYPWLTNKSAFQNADQLFRQKRGPIYQAMQSNLKAAGQLKNIDYHYKRAWQLHPEAPGMYVVEIMAKQGVKTFLGSPNQKQQPTRAKVNVPK